MPDQVAEETKSRRSSLLSAQQSEIKDALLQEYLDGHETAKVLFEDYDDNFIYGHTENFIEVKAPADPSLSGNIVTVQLIKGENGICFCKPLV